MVKTIPHGCKYRVSLPSNRCLGVLVCLGFALSACGDFGTTEMRARLAHAKTAKAATADNSARGSAAQSLSLFGAGDVSASTPFKTAVACATAFRVTATIIGKTAMFASDNEARRMRDAAEHFRRKAIAAADIRRADAAIEMQLQEVAADPGPQLQLAARCVRQAESNPS